jgi:nicotinamidase-related amidase
MSEIALIVIDMLNPYDHPDAERLVESVESVIEPLSGLIAGARDAGNRVIYVNDNYGEWTSSSERLAKAALEGRRPDLVEPILPPPDTPFVIKARHTIFYQTPLEYLLRQEGIGHVVLAGQVTEQCVLYSAQEAYVRHFKITVPSDAVAHIHADLADAALQMMRINMRTEVLRADEVRFG